VYKCVCVSKTMNVKQILQFSLVIYTSYDFTSYAKRYVYIV